MSTQWVKGVYQKQCLFHVDLRNAGFEVHVICFDFFFPQGERGSDGLPGYPGEEGSHVSTEFYFSP